MRQSLFERYGGFAKLNYVVSAFYERVLETAELEPYFADVDLNRLIDHQIKFIASILGGPASFSDDQLQRAHRRLNIDDAAFERMVEVFSQTLEDFDFDASDIERIVQQVNARKPYIVRPAQD